MKTHKFTQEEKAAIAHAINHLTANKITDPNYPFSGWYSGNREQFINRHEKSIKILHGFLASNIDPLTRNTNQQHRKEG